MTVQFGSDAPEDILIEREVDRAIANGCRVPRWGWPIPGPYNGSTGSERVVGWQKVRVAEDLGLLVARNGCGLCRAPDAPQWHAEVYARSLTSRPVCRSCHFHIHSRFKRPHKWCARVELAPYAETWVRQLRLVELSREQAMQIAMCRDVWAGLSCL